MNRRTLINYQLPYHIQMTISVYDICSVLAGLEMKVVSCKWGDELYYV